MKVKVVVATLKNRANETPIKQSLNYKKFVEIYVLNVLACKKPLLRVA